MKYTSFYNDGKMLRMQECHQCQWCGGTIPQGNLLVFRNYKIDNHEERAYQHLTCYDKTRAHCLESGHTFNYFNEKPIAALKQFKR